MSEPFEVGDTVMVACTCGKPGCVAPATSPKSGVIYDLDGPNYVFVDFWDTPGMSASSEDDSMTHRFLRKHVTRTDSAKVTPKGPQR